MFELILLVLLLIGVGLLFVPENKLKKINKSSLGLFLMLPVFGYITAMGVYNFVIELIEFVKGWVA